MPLAAHFGYPSLARPSLCPGPMEQGVSYVQISGLGSYIRNIRKPNAHRAMTTPPVVPAYRGVAMLNFAITAFYEVRLQAVR
jgi:hypothetical protein